MPQTLITHLLPDAPHGCGGGCWQAAAVDESKIMDIEKIQKLKTAWGHFAQGNIYCNMTLASATSAFQPVFDVRRDLAEADLRYTALMARRDTVDNEANDLMQRIVNAIKAEPNGDNSELYRALGYKTRNERAMPGPRTTATTAISGLSSQN